MLFILLVCLMPIGLKGQSSSGARFTSMGGAATALQDIYSLLSNQAGIVNLKSPVLAFTVEKPVLGTDIRAQSALAVAPFRIGTLGFSISSYGIPKVYKNLKSGLTFGRSFGPYFVMSLTANYHQLHIANYGVDEMFSLETGVQYKVSDHWTLGAHFENIGHFDFKSDSYYRIPSVIRIGSSYIINDEIVLSIDGAYRFEGDLSGNLGIEYAVISYFSLRGGISLNFFRQFVGFGIRYAGFVFDGAIASHPRLGYSPQISIAHVF